MLQGFQNIFITSLNLEQTIANLFTALLCGLLISIIYRSLYEGPNYSPKFIQANVVLSMITALVIMVIGNNLARAFGLVGAMSIIRFRTAVKDTQDIVFIFLALAAGMASGVGLRMIAFVGTLFIGGVLLGLHRVHYATPKKRDFLIQFLCELSGEEPPYLSVLERFCKRFRLVNMHSLDAENLYELSFYVDLKDKDKSSPLMKELNRIPEVNKIHFFFDEE